MSINTSKTQAQITKAIAALGLPQVGDETWVKRAMAIGLGARVARKAKAKGFWLGRVQAQVAKYSCMMLQMVASREATNLEYQMEEMRDSHLLLRKVDMDLLGLGVSSALTLLGALALGVVTVNPSMVNLGEAPGNRARLNSERLYKEAVARKEARQSSPEYQLCEAFKAKSLPIDCNF